MHSRSNTLRSYIASLLLLPAYFPAHACLAEGPAACAVKIKTLKEAVPLSSLSKNQQKAVLRAMSDDIAEIAEVDIARTERNKAAYRQYVSDRLQFEAIQGSRPDEQLLLVRYKSNTVCGQYENCPVWIVGLKSTKAYSMVPWQKELGTSAGGGWGVAIGHDTSSSYPELILLTHLSSTETGLACYRESKQQYLRVPCSPECTHWIQYAAKQ